MKRTSLFAAAFRKLAGLYALLAVVITLSFTIPPLIAQRQARESVESNGRLPQFVDQEIRPNVIVRVPADDNTLLGRIESFVSQRDDQYRRQLTLRLLEINGVMLLVTIAASYYLARYSLQPLQQTLDQQETFAAELAHELKTPLATALLELEDLQRSGKNLTTEQKKQVAQLVQDLKDVGTLTEQTLAMMAVEYTEAQQQFTTIGLQDSIERAQEMVAASAKSKHITITIEDIPTATIRGNEVQLRQLFVALLDNAIKYTPTDGSVTVRGAVKDGTVRIDVSDTGIGIPKELHEKIFQKFYQQDDAQGGTGLGLAIVRRIVEVHDGTITVESAPNKGATFSVRFPVVS